MVSDFWLGVLSEKLELLDDFPSLGNKLGRQWNDQVFLKARFRTEVDVVFIVDLPQPSGPTITTNTPVGVIKRLNFLAIE